MGGKEKERVCSYCGSSCYRLIQSPFDDFARRCTSELTFRARLERHTEDVRSNSCIASLTAAHQRLLVHLPAAPIPSRPAHIFVACSLSQWTIEHKGTACHRRLLIDPHIGRSGGSLTIAHGSRTSASMNHYHSDRDAFEGNSEGGTLVAPAVENEPTANG